MVNIRGHGEGTIYQLPSGKWRAQVSIGGSRMSHTARTRKECSDWIRRTAAQVERGLTYDKSKITLGDYLEHWMAAASSGLRATTLEHYRILADKYLIPAFGIVPIRELTSDRIQFAYDNLVKDGTGTYTVIKVHALLHTILQRAEDTGLVMRNAADQVYPPAKPHQEMRFWSEEEANRFLTAARDNRLYALFYLAIVTGARQMELLGLQWSDLDWVKRTLRFQRQLTRQGEFAQLKTEAGRRTIFLGDGTLGVLRGHLERQNLERQFAGKRWRASELMFTTLKGTPVQNKNLIERYFRPLIEAAGVPLIRFHDLRHTAVAIMLSHGRPVIAVSKIVGHSRPSITSDIYGHLVPDAGIDTGMMDDLVAPVEIIELTAPELHTK